MKNIIIIVSFLTAHFNGLIAQVNIEKWQFLQGNWTGTLEYTDYKDDKTPVTLPTLLTAAFIKDKMQLAFIYDESNGRWEYSDSQISATKQEKEIKWGNQKFKIISDTEGVSNERTIVLETQGEDNNKKALIRETIRCTANTLSILKEVQYAGTNAFFQRHIYRFKKESEAETEARLLKDLIGIWGIDLRPTPEAQAYLKDFEIKGVNNGQLKGIFYGTEFNEGKINTSWGKIYFSFTTADQSNTYFHSGYIEKGVIHGTSYSKERDFMIPWVGHKK